MSTISLYPEPIKDDPRFARVLMLKNLAENNFAIMSDLVKEENKLIHASIEKERKDLLATIEWVYTLLPTNHGVMHVIKQAIDVEKWDKIVPKDFELTRCSKPFVISNRTLLFVEGVIHPFKGQRGYYLIQRKPNSFNSLPIELSDEELNQLNESIVPEFMKY
jgi:hypothetical protein